jgi:hypothetical protein
LGNGQHVGSKEIIAWSCFSANHIIFIGLTCNLEANVLLWKRETANCRLLQLQMSVFNAVDAPNILISHHIAGTIEVGTIRITVTRKGLVRSVCLHCCTDDNGY